MAMEHNVTDLPNTRSSFESNKLSLFNNYVPNGNIIPDIKVEPVNSEAGDNDEYSTQNSIKMDQEDMSKCQYPRDKQLNKKTILTTHFNSEKLEFELNEEIGKAEILCEKAIKLDEVHLKSEDEDVSFKNPFANGRGEPVRNRHHQTVELEQRKNEEGIFGNLIIKNEKKSLDKKDDNTINLTNLLNGFSGRSIGHIRDFPILQSNINNQEDISRSTNIQFLLNTNIRVIPRPIPKTTKKSSMFKCNYCVHQATTRRNLRIHSFTHKKPEECDLFKCFNCDYETIHKCDIRRHLLLRHKDPRDLYKCDQCVYQTADKTSFTRHMHRHKILEEVDAYKCEQCNYQSTTKYAMEQHVLLHKNPEEINWYKCKDCSYRTTFRHVMKKHVVRHKRPEDITWHQCDKCVYKTADKYLFRRHHLIRHDSKSEEHIMHKCLECEFETKYKHSLKAHFRRHHAKGKQIVL